MKFALMRFWIKDAKYVEEGILMARIVDEIVENASTIPLECQEHILDIGKAMAFTRKVMQTKQNFGEKEKNQKQHD